MKMRFVGLKQLFLLVTCTVFVALSSQGQDQPPQDQTSPPPANNEAPAPEQAQPSQLSAQQLQELVAPIALYPDALVAQILAASAYPTQIVEAKRFLQQNPDLKGAELAAAVDKQDWDPSVKALTQFPSVLSNMDKDLSWTSELGDANYNQQADLMSAVQYMRQQAKQAGTLKSTPQQTVTDQGNNIDIAPADPNEVYVPDYDPELVYGYPVALWPGFYPWWGVTGPYLSFGIGFGVGPFFGYGWGWNHWGFDWYHRGLVYGGAPYLFHSHAFYDRNAYFHGGYRGGMEFNRGDRGFRGYGPPGGGRFGGRAAGPPARSWGRSGAFGGVSRGGVERGFSARGRSSFGGGMRGGGMRGGAPRGGGGRH